MRKGAREAVGDGRARGPILSVNLEAGNATETRPVQTPTLLAQHRHTAIYSNTQVLAQSSGRRPQGHTSRPRHADSGHSASLLRQTQQPQRHSYKGDLSSAQQGTLPELTGCAGWKGEEGKLALPDLLCATRPAMPCEDAPVQQGRKLGPESSHHLIKARQRTGNLWSVLSRGLRHCAWPPLNTLADDRTGQGPVHSWWSTQ